MIPLRAGMKLRSVSSDSPAAKILVLVSVFMFWFAHYVYMPTLPQYVQERTANLTQVGIVLSMYGLWQAIVRLPIGIFTDRIGRRKGCMLAGILMAGAGSLTLAAASNFPMLTFGRSLVGLSMSAWVLQVVFFGTLFSGEKVIKAGAILTTASSLAKLTGTFSTGYLNAAGGYSLAFLVSAGAVVLSVIFLLPVEERPFGRPSGAEGKEPDRIAGKRFQLKPIITHPRVVLVSILAGVNQFLNFGIVFGFFPIKAEMMGASDLMKSYLLSVNILCLIGGNLLTTSIGKRENTVMLLSVSYLFFALGIILTPAVGSIGLLFILQALLGFAHGVSYPVLIGACIQDIPQNGRATAMGFHQSVYAVGMFLGPWIAGALADSIGIDATFYSIGGGAAALCLVLLILLRRHAYAPRRS